VRCESLTLSLGTEGLTAGLRDGGLALRGVDGQQIVVATVHTREMPVRRGHEVSLITTTHRRPRVLALANWTTIDGVNYARGEPPGLVKVGDVLWLAVGFVGVTARLRDAGMVLFVPVAAVVLAVVATVSWAARRRLAWRVDWAIDLEAWRTAKGQAPLH
jgi:hypothetical protein